MTQTTEESVLSEHNHDTHSNSSDDVKEPKLKFAIALTSVILAAFRLSLRAPTSSPSRMVAFLATMFAVTGAVVAVVVWAAKGKA